MKQKYIIILLLILPLFALGQSVKKVFIGFSSDSLGQSHFIEFVDDSTVYIKNIWPHNYIPVKVEYKYSEKDEMLILKRKDSLHFEDEKYLEEKLGITESNILYKKGKAQINYKNQTAYMLKDDFGKGYLMKVFIDGEIFTRTKAKLSRKSMRLRKKLKNINPEDYRVFIYKGLIAFEKFGYRSIPGIVEFDKK